MNYVCSEPVKILDWKIKPKFWTVCAMPNL